MWAALAESPWTRPFRRYVFGRSDEKASRCSTHHESDVLYLLFLLKLYNTERLSGHLFARLNPFSASRRLTKLFQATVHIHFLGPTDEDIGNPNQMAKPPPLPTQKKKGGCLSGCALSISIGFLLLVCLFAISVFSDAASRSHWNKNRPSVLRSIDDAVNEGNYEKALSLAQPHQSRGDSEINALIAKTYDLKRRAEEQARQEQIDQLISDIRASQGGEREAKMERLLALAPDTKEFVDEFSALREKAKRREEETRARQELERRAELQRKAQVEQEQIRLAMELKLAEFKWKYAVRDDELTSKPSYHAAVKSINRISFDFPYHGEQRGELLLRTHPQYGKNLIFRVERGQILVNSFQDSVVKVVFDQGSPISYKVAGPSDHSTTSLFLRDYHGFVDRMVKAKKVKISVPFYQQGDVVFEFNVSDFESNRYLGKTQMTAR
jgi:hypothetical protein